MVAEIGVSKPCAGCTKTKRCRMVVIDGKPKYFCAECRTARGLQVGGRYTFAEDKYFDERR